MNRALYYELLALAIRMIELASEPEHEIHRDAMTAGIVLLANFAVHRCNVHFTTDVFYRYDLRSVFQGKQVY